MSSTNVYKNIHSQKQICQNPKSELAGPVEQGPLFFIALPPGITKVSFCNVQINSWLLDNL